MVPLPVGILLSCNLFLYHSKRNKFITTAITFAHFTLAFDLSTKIWEACKILNLKHGSIACWYSFVMQFISLSFQKEQIYYNGNNFCAFDASFDLSTKIWEACKILNLKHGSIACWYSFVMQFYFSISFQKEQIYYNGNNFCAFDATLRSENRFEKLVKFWT